MDLGNQRSVEEGPSARGRPDRAALEDRHASSARTVRTGVPLLRVEMAPPKPTPVLLHAFRCLHPKRAGALLGNSRSPALFDLSQCILFRSQGFDFKYFWALRRI